MKSILTILLAAVAWQATAAHGVHGGVTCVACQAVATLVEQNGGKGPSKLDPNPSETCRLLNFCDGQCKLFTHTPWPAKSPVFPEDNCAIDDNHTPAKCATANKGDTPSRGTFHDKVVPALRQLQQVEADRMRPDSALPALDFVTGMAEFFRILAAGQLEQRLAAAEQAEQAPLARALAMHTPCEDYTNVSCDITRFGDQHLPILTDLDGDKRAGDVGGVLVDGLRGASWRGLDCDDFDDNTYAGRRPRDGDRHADTNCNGIKGGNATGTYEDLFCSGANAPMGLAILGDSATAHFHIPARFVNARNFNLEGVLEFGLNEGDWPQCSWSTSIRDPAGCPRAPLVETSSIYQRMFERNRCIHRDYTNVGVNGARVGAVADGFVQTLGRNPTEDAPLLVFHALIGNDVCNSSPDPAHMTTPTEFRQRVLSTLTQLNATLPIGSNVAFLGLAQGTLLYNITHTHTHPIGTSYPEFYDFLNCVDVSPCAGWLTSNETDRINTQKRANELSAVYSEIVADNSTDFHFEMFNVPLDWEGILQEYLGMGGNEFDLVEWVDGFHPAQTFNGLIAKSVWESLESQRPHFLPAVNPHNAEIEALFGDQGGY